MDDDVIQIATGDPLLELNSRNWHMEAVEPVPHKKCNQRDRAETVFRDGSSATGCFRRGGGSGLGWVFGGIRGRRVQATILPKSHLSGPTGYRTRHTCPQT